MKKIVILGSTGSIGTQTLDVIRSHPNDFKVIGLSAHENTDLFQRQVHEFAPRYVVQTSVAENPQAALSSLASSQDADIIVNAIGGSAGLLPAFAACKAGKRIALANKESIVMAGELLMSLVKKTGAEILPIDSEPSAIWQMTGNGARGTGHREGIEKIILTASGGPFWKWKNEELKRVSAEQALKHPTWKMGEKVSIDSATLMNKAFEIIETRWMFNISPQKIDVVIHRQSLVHSLVQWKDGNVSAVLAAPDMRIPISYALFYPDHSQNTLPRLDFSSLELTFEKPDYSVFEGPKLAYEVLAAGGIMPAAFCLADEAAVNKFLKGEISFLGIYDFVKNVLDKVKNVPLTMEALSELRSQFKI